MWQGSRVGITFEQRLCLRYHANLYCFDVNGSGQHVLQATSERSNDWTALPRSDQVAHATTFRGVDFRDGNLGRPGGNLRARKRLRRLRRETNL